MTIWYDFTTTVRNRGRSGIANVEWNIGQSLLACDPNVRCFQLDHRRGLVEMDPTAQLAETVYASPLNQARTITTALPTWRSQIRSLLSALLGPRATPIIRSISTVYQLPKTVRRAATGRAEQGRHQRNVRLRDAVGPDDVVVSMGADWEGELARQLGELKQRTGCRVVTMVYDLVPLTHTHLAFHVDRKLFTRYYETLIKVSDLITCISSQSRRDLVAFGETQSLEVPRSEVLVLGESATTARSTDAERADFYLCVGTIERRKNIELVYDALRILDSKGHDLPRVIVAGTPGWGTSDLLAELALRSTPASRAMVLLGSVDDETLDRLYLSAKALLFPSHFEGWGLPVREAAIRGCPVAVGDNPAVREAAASYEGATFLPADDPGAWANYLLEEPNVVEPTPIRPWAVVATDLLTMFADGQ